MRSPAAGTGRGSLIRPTSAFRKRGGSLRANLRTISEPVSTQSTYMNEGRPRINNRHGVRYMPHIKQLAAAAAEHMYSQCSWSVQPGLLAYGALGLLGTRTVTRIRTGTGKGKERNRKFTDLSDSEKPEFIRFINNTNRGGASIYWKSQGDPHYSAPAQS